MAMVQRLHGLLEANGDEQAYDDSGDVDEKVASALGDVVGGVNVEHLVALLRGIWKLFTRSHLMALSLRRMQGRGALNFSKTGFL
jgi:hypothetical protein